MKTQKTTVLALLVGVILVMGTIAWKVPAANPLQNTSWKGTVMMPDAEQGVLSFKKDTLLASIDDVVMETGFYQVKGDTLTIKKISGGSPCIYEVGYYHFTLKADKLFITLIKDDCGARSGAFAKEGYQKITN